MTTTLPQALLIGLVYFTANTSFLAGLGYFTTWRPLVNGLLVGLILGDPVRGVSIGALINVLYLGYLSVGGTLGIGDAALAGILGAVVGILSPLTDPIQASGLGVLCGVLLGNLGFPLLSLRMSLDNHIARRMDGAAKRGDTTAVSFWNIWAGQGVLLAITLPLAAVLALVSPVILNALIALLPFWTTRAIGLAGTGLAGALGIALAMKFVFRRQGVLLFYIGFGLIASTHINVAYIFVAAVFVVMAYYLLSGKVVLRVNTSTTAVHTFWLWQFFSHSSYSFERLQGSGLAAAIAPALHTLYPDLQQRSAAIQRHLEFFNVEPNWGSVIVGIFLKLEEEIASRKMPPDVITSVRQSLMGAVSGFGDTTSQGAFLPFLLSIGLAISLDSQVLSPTFGVAAYLLMICPLMLYISYHAFWLGYEQGRDGVITLLGNSVLKKWIRIVELMGAFMLGALAATPAITGLHISLPNMLLTQVINVAVPLCLVLLFYMLMERFHVRPILVMAGIIGFSLLLTFLAIL